MKMQVFLSLSLLGLLLACTPTAQIQKSWSDPSLTAGTIKPFKKILVVASLKDESSRRIAEDKMAAQIKKSVVVVKSYDYMQATDKDQKLLEEKLRKDGFDGILLMHLLEIEKSTSYVPGSSYGGWYGRGGWYGGYSYSPGYYTEDKTFIVETNAYSLESNKLLWSIATSTMNPSKVDKSIDGVIYAVKNELMKKGLIPKE
jgi:hypothetical protein